jgi:hypothetical protein
VFLFLQNLQHSKINSGPNIILNGLLDSAHDITQH